MARLAALQASGWLGLEASERALLGHHLDGFIGDPRWSSASSCRSPSRSRARSSDQADDAVPTVAVQW
ncbi:MAG: hypothetical protein M3P34_03315 [Actinomycetota bacterium]|nr:hypothetical protein [Actinomycetota bacterium]